MKTSFIIERKVAQFLICCLVSCVRAAGQVNSGSDGSDGELKPTRETVIDMTDHPDGVYQYSSVHIPSNVQVTFLRNPANTPVVWLVQGSCIIDGVLDLSGQSGSGSQGGAGGPGGYAGGNGGVAPSAGQGPGGGKAGGYANSASYGAVAKPWGTDTSGLGSTYGNQFLVPLLGGSGGAAGNGGAAGGGGGGAILIVSSTEIKVNGAIQAQGGGGAYVLGPSSAGGAGSGGAVRLVATKISGFGNYAVTVDTSGGFAGNSNSGKGGKGRVRLDGLEIRFTGPIEGVFSQGFQPITIPPANQAVTLGIQSIAGVAVPRNPAGILTTPDVIIPGQQQNPISIVIRCGNIPLNTEITVEVKPANGPAISAVGINNAGTLAASTATISLDVPRGGGTIQAKAISGIAGTLGAGLSRETRSYVSTGLTTDGESFSRFEVIAALDNRQQLVYLTDSGKRLSLPALD